MIAKLLYDHFQGKVMDVQDLEIRHLKLIDALLRYRNGTVAAKHLGISQPAVSQSLNRLRVLFDDPLFMRTERGLEPSPRALSLAGPVAEILNLVDGGLLQKETFDPLNDGRRFVVSTGELGELSCLPDLIKQITHLSPRSSLIVVPADTQSIDDLLDNGTVDLAIGYLPELTSPNYMQQSLFHHGLGCLASESLDVPKEGLTPEAFGTFDHALIGMEGRLRTLYDQMVLEQGLRPRIVLQLPHLVSIPVILPSAGFLVIASDFLCKHFSKQKGIVRYPLPYPSPMMNIRQIWHRRKHQDPAHKWLRQLTAQLWMRK